METRGDHSEGNDETQWGSDETWYGNGEVGTV